MVQSLVILTKAVVAQWRFSWNTDNAKIQIFFQVLKSKARIFDTLPFFVNIFYFLR